MTPTEILKTYHRVASVGLSDRAESESNAVGHYLIGAGYDLIPVTPTYETVLGRDAYPTLADIPGEPPEIVQIFRPSETVGPIVDQAIQVGAKVIWMQMGITNDDAAEKARAAGLEVVMDRCMKVDHALHVAH